MDKKAAELVAISAYSRRMCGMTAGLDSFLLSLGMVDDDWNPLLTNYSLEGFFFAFFVPCFFWAGFGFWLLAFGFWLWLLAFGFWLLAPSGIWLLAFGSFWLLASGFCGFWLGCNSA